MQRTPLALAFLLLVPPAAAQIAGAPRGPQEDGLVRRADLHGREARAWRDAGAVRPDGLGHGISASGWSGLGPFGGDAQDVAVSPTTAGVVLAGFAPSGGPGGTLSRSEDDGATWSELVALSGLSVYDIEFAPDGTVWIGTFDGVWTSADDGVTWVQQPLGIGANDQVFEVTLDPSDATRIWIGVADALGSQTQNVLLSTDGGASWSDRTPIGAAGTSCTAVAVSPVDPDEVFAAFGGGFGGGSVWGSLNGGVGWTNRSGGLPANPMTDLHHDGARVLLTGGQLFGSQDVGLYESTNLGVTWTALHDSTWPSLVLNDVEVDSADPDVVWVASAGSGAFRSTDGGTSWTFGLGGGLSVNEVEVDPAGTVPVYLASSSVAVSKSADGTSFDPSSVGIGALNVESIAHDPADPERLAVAFQGLNDGGVYTSPDGGTTWELADLPGTRFNTVGFAPDSTLYAISDGPTSVAPEGLYREEGDGSWTSIGPDQGALFESELFALGFGGDDPDVIVTGGSDFGVAGAEMTMWVTTDGGAMWTKAYEGLANEDVRDVARVQDGTDVTWVAAYTDFGTSQSGGALRSTDAGASWAPTNTGLAAGAQCWGVASSPLDADTVYLTDDDVPTGAIYRSTDAGATWQGMGLTQRARDVVASPLRYDRIFVAANSGAAVVVSEDGGATATPFDDGLGSGGAGAPLALDLVARACNRLLLATSTGTYGEDAAGCRLEADATELSVSAGGTANLDLAAGPDQATRLHFVLGSATGTSPGFTFRGVTLPLVADALFTDTLMQANSPAFQGTVGTLDADGQSAAALVLPAGSDPGLVGLETYWAYAVLALGPLDLFLASNAVLVTLVP